MASNRRRGPLEHVLLILLSIVLFCLATIGFFAGDLLLGTPSVIGAVATALLGIPAGPREDRLRQGCLISVAGVLFGFLVLVMNPIYARDHRDSRTECLSNIKQIAMSMVMYAGDHDGRFSLAATWYRELPPYAGNEALFHCPLATSPWSYAMDRSMAGANAETLKDPEEHVLIFEANAALPDASGGREWLVPRHPSGDKTVANIAFADGHARAYTFDEAAQFKW
ncbi:MAG: hypothetical protein M9921_00105 [Fimbriimonadaceae bacterium]|nr:hypothetical protein [Chthonomonadaceae bacterium]MCO5295239.1 hypothetical protein [Fimbriimonadaceae bacterium]